MAAVTPIVMFLAWIWINGWSGSQEGFIEAVVEISIGAVVAGSILGLVFDGTLGRGLIALITYGVVAWLAVLPINAVGSTWEELRAGRVSGPIEIGTSIGSYLLVGLVNSLYGFVYLLPFGAGWMLSLLLLRRAFLR